MRRSVALVPAAAVTLLSIGAYRQHATSADITAGDLRARLETFAHDSMEGRLTGSAGHGRAVRYLVESLRELGVQPRGEARSYVQTLPLDVFRLDIATSRLAVGENRYSIIPDEWDTLSTRGNAGLAFLPLPSVLGFQTRRTVRVPNGVSALDLIYGGRLGDANAVQPRIAKGAAVLFAPPLRANRQSSHDLWPVREHLASYRDAAMILVATLDLMPRAELARLSGPQFELRDRRGEPQRMPPIVAVSRGIMSPLVQRMGEPHNARLTYQTRALPLAVPAQNVIAVVEGSDPDLRSEFVVISAHSDNLGVDSGAGGEHAVFNGADDGGSGAVALLEIAEHLVRAPQKPRRSVLFLWTAAEEQGFLGAEHFADHPTIERGDIVASISIDRIGRAADSVLVSGSRSVAAPLGEWLRTANTDPALRVVVGADAAGEVCASDSWHFARWTIPSAHISAPPNADTHQVTDDVSRIDFAQFARVSRYVAAAVHYIANQPARLRGDTRAHDQRQVCAR